jgi:hypothetical protein
LVRSRPQIFNRQDSKGAEQSFGRATGARSIPEIEILNDPWRRGALAVEHLGSALMNRISSGGFA